LLFKILNSKKVKIITHPYNFHLDDLFSVATVTLFLEKRGRSYEIIRENDADFLKKQKKKATENIDQEDIFLLDIGSEYNPNKNFFDHHQKGGVVGRENGVPYSSFGLV
jgi:uncharacterized UPF0160 family protein